MRRRQRDGRRNSGQGLVECEGQADAVLYRDYRASQTCDTICGFPSDYGRDLRADPRRDMTDSVLAVNTDVM
jgi:hypothetical protein